jgi:hypothetical protein
LKLQLKSWDSPGQSKVWRLELIIRNQEHGNEDEDANSTFDPNE